MGDAREPMNLTGGGITFPKVGGSRFQEATRIKILDVWIDCSRTEGRQSLLVDVWWDDS